jgi:hypothetical protein
MRRDIIEKKRALSFLGSHLTEREQTAETAVSRAVARECEKARCVLKVEPGADDKFDPANVLGGEMSTHHAGKGVAIGDGDRLELERACRRYQLLGMRAPAQEGEIGGDVELGVAGHAIAPAHALLCHARESGHPVTRDLRYRETGGYWVSRSSRAMTNKK